MIPSEIEPLVEALRPIKVYLPDLVLVGGWVPLLNKFYNNSYEYNGIPILTKDVDLVCPQSLPVIEDNVDSLLTKAGFESKLLGHNARPVSRYVKKFDIEIEFLTPKKGQGSEDNIYVQKRLLAQSLSYLDILLEHKTLLKITGTDLEIYTPELPAFIYQKALSFPLRTSEAKKAKDLYYIYQVLNSSDMDDFIHRLKQQIFPSHPKSWAVKSVKNLDSQFKGIDDMGVDSVFRQAKELTGYATDEILEKRKIFTTFSEFIHRLKS